MSTTRLSFGAVLGTVQSTANAVTGALDAASAGIGMLNSFVTQAADNQRVRQIADKEDFVENLIMEKAEQRATAYLKVEKFCGKSPDHAKHYQGAYERFTQLLRTPEELEILKAAAASTQP